MYEIYPERAEYQKEGDSVRASVRTRSTMARSSTPFARRACSVGETRRDDRYFRPDKNPVVLTGLRQDTVTVDAGRSRRRWSVRRFGRAASSRTRQAQVWFTDDANRYPVQVKAKFSKFTLTLALESVIPGVQPGALPSLIAQATEP